MAANDRFGEVVLQHYQPGDMVWLQDYHLMLLPQILKAAHPKMKVGGRRGQERITHQPYSPGAALVLGIAPPPDAGHPPPDHAPGP